MSVRSMIGVQGLPSEPIDVRKVEQAKKAEALIQTGPVTLVLVYADWCGHCHKYLPKWKEMGKTKHRKANIISVHHDMMDKIPSLRSAKIQGYPSVVKLSPQGQMTQYKVPNSSEMTNALPHMRDMTKMIQELTIPDVPTTTGNITKVLPNILNRISKSSQRGGSMLHAVSSAVQQAGPAALLLMANGALQGHYKNKTFKSPKRSTRRASTRKSSKYLF